MRAWKGAFRCGFAVADASSTRGNRQLSALRLLLLLLCFFLSFFLGSYAESTIIRSPAAGLIGGRRGLNYSIHIVRDGVTKPRNCIFNGHRDFSGLFKGLPKITMLLSIF
jgi:hypothetical protein